MLEFKEFENYMLKIKEQIKKEKKLDEALHEMSPDFGGFSSESVTIIVDLLKKLMNDDEEWISYYIWESDWGKIFPCVWDKDDNEIPLETLEDLYNIIVEKGE